MTNTQHTPGPWAYGYEPTLNRHVVRAGFAGEQNICSTYGAGAKSYECAANARLIAAAPEMLDLLIEAVSRVRDLQDGHQLAVEDLAAWADDAQEAIAKATEGAN